MSRKIKARLSEDSLDKAIKALETEKRLFDVKVFMFREKIAEKMAQYAQQGFSNAVVDVLVTGQEIKASDVVIAINRSGEVTVVTAIGPDAVWAEFGTGVHYNGSAGSSPHPTGIENGMTIGQYGYGLGKLDSWRIDEETRTYGAPASMPMYRASEAVARDIRNIAREVFG